MITDIQKFKLVCLMAADPTWDMLANKLQMFYQNLTWN